MTVRFFLLANLCSVKTYLLYKLLFSILICQILMGLRLQPYSVSDTRKWF